jgi:hypothetical protein
LPLRVPRAYDFGTHCSELHESGRSGDEPTLGCPAMRAATRTVEAGMAGGMPDMGDGMV